MKTIKLEKDTHQKLKDFCEEKGFKISAKADQIINDYVEERKREKVKSQKK